MLRHSCCEVRVMQLHDILQLRTSLILPEAISDGGLAPTTDTSLFLTTYRGGSHLPSDINLLAASLSNKVDFPLIELADINIISTAKKLDANDVFIYSAIIHIQPLNEVGLYTYRKMLLEKELQKVHEQNHFAYTILRPAFVFGPYNYAPRESWFIQNVIQNHSVYYPSDSTGHFQMIYIKDAAEAIIRCIQSEKSHNEAYNLSAPEVLTYQTFLDELHNASDVDFTEQNVTVARSLTARIPFPFPLTEAESELFDGSKLTDELSLTYTPFSEALAATYRAMKGIYL